MDWMFSATNNSFPHKSIDDTPLRNETARSIEPYFTNELFSNLKKGYDERLRNLENHLKTTYEIIENDEIIRTMKLSSVSEEFRKQRINEIIEDSLASEKEAEIDRLTKTNSYLKTELLVLEQENQKIRQAYEEETGKFQNTVTILNEELEQEREARNALQQERQNMVSGLTQWSQQKEELLNERETHLKTLRQKDSYIDEMKSDFEKIKNSYVDMEKAYNQLKEEHSGLLKALNSTEDIHKVTQAQIQELKDKLKQSEELRENLQKERDRTVKESEELMAKSEYISLQVKQIIEEEQKNSVQMIEEMKEKFRVKIEEQMTQIRDLTLTNEDLVKEGTTLREELTESKLNCEKIIALMKNDMRVIKNEWEKRCQEVELASERTVEDLKMKHQLQITQLQTEYQTLLNKKIAELQNETHFSNYGPRPIDIEAKNQLENRLNQIEKDYILKTKHENILNTELLDLKTKHAQELKELEEKYERDLGERVQGVAEKNRFEFESTIVELKAQNRSLEQQVTKLKSENQSLVEKLNNEIEKTQRLTIEAEESDNNRKNLKISLDEANNKIKSLQEEYEKEAQNLQAKSSQLEEFSEKELKFSAKERDLRNQIELLTNEIGEFKNLASSQEKQLGEAGKEIVKSSAELAESQKIHQALEKENNRLNDEILNLNDQIAVKTQQIDNLKRELEDVRQKLIDDVEKARRVELKRIEDLENEFESKVSNIQTQYDILSQSITERDEKIEDLNGTITKLENFITDLQKRAMELEVDVACSQTDCREMEGQLSKLRIKLNGLSSKGIQLKAENLSVLREEVEKIRAQMNTELAKCQEIAKRVITEIVREFQGKVTTFETVANEEKEKEISRIIKEYELKIRDQGLNERNVLETLHLENESLKRELQGKNQEAKSMWNTYQEALQKLEKENSGLRELSSQKTQELLHFKAFVDEEITRLKQESIQTMNENIRHVEKKYKEEIKQASKTIEELKESHIERLGKFEEMIKEVETVYGSYLTEQKNSFDETLQNYEKEIADLVVHIENKDKETKEMQKELIVVQEKYKEQRAENERLLETFEEKIAVFRDLVQKEESERSLSYRTEENSSKVDSELREENLLLRREIRIKDFKIEELQKAKEEIRQDVLRYKDLLERKEKSFESQQRELLKTGRRREKEIEELQILLKKSIDSYNSTLDNNMRITNRLERDADEIAKTVRLTTRSDYNNYKR